MCMSIPNHKAEPAWWRDVDCPHCGAKAGENCWSPQGHRQARPHAKRKQLASGDLPDTPIYMTANELEEMRVLLRYEYHRRGRLGRMFREVTQAIKDKRNAEG